jgi:APA family basic amino acid/polyamine antiporter
MALAVLISVFGGLSSTILTVSRIYLPMAEDGVFFRSLARIHPTCRTPNASLVAQGAWSAALTLWGTFEQLLGYGGGALFLFHAATGLALFRLRRQRRKAIRALGRPLGAQAPLVSGRSGVVGCPGIRKNQVA